MCLCADAVLPCIFLFSEVFEIANDTHQVNEEILDSEVRLISEDGEQLGIMSSAEALRIAEEHEMDLVKIAPNSNPPVCRIMDYGKFRFEQTKKEKEAKKNQHVIDIKEIRMGPSIGENDFNTKLKNGMKFLNDGDRLKVSVRFRGREMAHTEIGEALLKDFAEKCAEVAVLDKAPKLEGRNMTIFLSPKPVTPPKKPAKPKQPKPQAPADEVAE
ncbi:MAG: translation initiation factor IF-3 [Oscillospiraceae bacterium]|nr:translation initiation factor IF-3 [Oscillospiraceae bacterium]